MIATTQQNYQGNSVVDCKGLGWAAGKTKPDKNWRDKRFDWLRGWVKKQKGIYW